VLMVVWGNYFIALKRGDFNTLEQTITQLFASIQYRMVL